jgi:hypothetical protein
MNWTKIVGAGVVAGIVINLVDFVLHGLVMADTYRKYSDVFSQEQANPIWFFVVAIVMATLISILFAKTRDAWADGAKGGMTYGFWLGLIAFSSYFYNPLVIDGYPYYLAWCQGGITLIGVVIGGAVIGLMIKR